MFQTELQKGVISGEKLSRPALISVVAHVGAVALVVALGTSSEVKKIIKSPVVTFFTPKVAAPPAPPAISLGTGEPSAPVKRVQEKTFKKKKALATPKLVAPKEAPFELPKEAGKAHVETPSEGPDDSNTGRTAISGGSPLGVAGGMEKGVVGGINPGGIPGGVVGGSAQGGGNVFDLAEGMTKPERIAGDPPVYSREAIAARVSGLVLVKCVITEQGDARDCRIHKALPHLNEAVLTALSTWKFKPSVYRGQNISVKYLIPIKLVPPRQ